MKRTVAPPAPRVMSALAVLAASALAVPTGAQDRGIFETPMLVPNAAGGEFRARADFDGDGQTDLLEILGSQSDPTGMVVFLADGTGGFVRQTQLDFSFASGVELSPSYQVVIGDIDGNGDVDVVLDRSVFGFSTSGEEGIEVYFGDGAGGFLGTSFFTLPSQPLGVVVAGNIDGDAADEIAVLHSDMSFIRFVTWLDWNGSALTATGTLALLGNETLRFAHALDVDGDGVDDLVGTFSTPYDKLVFLPTVAGAPTLGTIWTPAPGLQQAFNGLNIGDVDGDGDTDFVHVERTATDPTTWIQPYEQTATGWVQRAAQELPTRDVILRPYDLVLADWDADGWADLFSFNGAVSALRSNADWTWSEGFQVASIGNRSGAGPMDVDGDGHLDYVGARTITFGDGTFAVDTSDPIETPPGIGWVDGIHAIDSEGDGDVDFLGAAGGAFLTNDSTGDFELEMPPFPTPAPGFVLDGPVAFGDFDGDGRREFLMRLIVVPVGGTSTVFRMVWIPEDGKGGHGDAYWATSAGVEVPVIAFSDESYWDSGDVDGDGDLDLLLVNGYRQNDGTGYLDTFVSADVGRGRSTADVEGDGDVDILVTRVVGQTSQVWLYLSDGSGGYTTNFLITRPGNDVDAQFVDLDLDGDQDVIAGDPDEPGLALFENAGGSYGPLVELPGAVAPYLRLMVVRDVDGDGQADLFVQNDVDTQSPTLAVYRGTSGGVGFEIAYEHVGAFDVHGYADIDSDGDVDAIGRRVVRGSIVEDLEGGAIRQYGAGVAGTDGFTPILGATGPVTSASSADSLRLVNALGGSSTIIVFGLTEAAIPDTPLPTLTLFVGSPIRLPLLPLTGTPGVGGEGTLTVPLPPVPGLYGVSFFHQAFVVDPASPVGWTASNGLEITYGL